MDPKVCRVELSRTIQLNLAYFSLDLNRLLLLTTESAILALTSSHYNLGLGIICLFPPLSHIHLTLFLCAQPPSLLPPFWSWSSTLGGAA